MASTSDFSSTFVPRQLLPRTFGKETVYVYPELENDMCNAEKSYGFLTSKAAVEAANIKFDTKLQLLAGVTRTGPLVEVASNRFKNHALNLIRRVNNFEVLSYHNRAGQIMVNALAEGILKPTDGQNAANRRPANIMYVKLACDVRFDELDPSNTDPAPFSYFVRLPMENLTVTNSIGGELQLNTFHGPSNWNTIADQEVLNAIWNHPRSYRKPFLLKPPTIVDANADAIIEPNTLILDHISLEAAWTTITVQIYNQICPTVTSDPAAIIQNIHQVTKDKDGNEKVLSVQEYFNAVQQMTNFLPKNENWILDITQHFNTHLIERICLQMHATDYVYNSATAQRDGYSQMMFLQTAFAKATSAENNIDQIQQIAKAEMSNQSFIVNANKATVAATVAENTLRLHAKVECWGCLEKGHSFANKEGNVTCPKKDDPSVITRAAKARKDFNLRQAKKKIKKRKSRDSNGSSNMLAKALSKLSTEQIQTLIGGATGSTSPTKNPRADIHQAFPIKVLQSNTTKPMLPISVESNLPHIALPIGHIDAQRSMALLVAYDTCAAINCGNLLHHLPIMEKCPETVKSVSYAKDEYSPIVLSGIVNDSDNDTTTKPTATLPVVVEYHLPFLTKEGHKTSVKIALGKDVSVNTILGLPTIRPAKMSLDLSDNVVESGVLDTEPFPVLFRPTSVSTPDFSKIDSANSSLLITEVTYDHVSITDIKACRTFVENEVNIKAAICSDFESNVDMTSSTQENAKSPATIIVPKQKWRPKTESLWKEKEPIKDPHFDYLFQTRAGFALRKQKPQFLPPPNPNFHRNYDETRDGKELFANLKLEPGISKRLRLRITSFVKEFWDVFYEDGVKIPVRGYEMMIDTGNHKPIAVAKPHYGMHEAPIMQKTIDKLLDNGFIKRDTSSPWGFRITLAPKPHQESVTDIDEYIWRFCINYIRLNMITRPAEYPILRCDDAVMFGFGLALYFILLDAHSGYHQIALDAESAAKTAFFAPHGRKYIWTVMPFGPRNCPVIFIAMMHDLKELWTSMCADEGIDLSADNGTTIIMDDTFLFGATIDTAFILLRCVCQIARKYQLTWKLKKSQWFPEAVQFVGVDMHTNGGNTPAKAKDPILKGWKNPETRRDIMAFIGFAIFYLRWCPWFEMKIKPLRQIMHEKTLDHKFTSEEFDASKLAIFDEIRSHILSKPILQRANIKKRFYLKTDFSSKGLGFALCQPDDSPESLAAMKREDEGGDCEFEFCVSKKRLLPVAFGSRKTIGNEEHFHSHPGESLAASWGTIKNRHFLWGRAYSLMTDCRALMWLNLTKRLSKQGWHLHATTMNSCEHFSDLISANFELIIGLSPNYFHSQPIDAWKYLSPTPAVPNGMSPKILVEFNNAKFALQHIGDLFTVEPQPNPSSRLPTVEYIVRLKMKDSIPPFDAGFQIYNKDSPAPLPSKNTQGLFGGLFGISFDNPGYTPENNERKKHIRAIAIAEYTSLFGYDENFSAHLNGQPDVLKTLRRTLPCQTTSRIAETANQLLRLSIDQRSHESSSSSGIDLSFPALFNGIIGDELPDESAWQLAYKNDQCCSSIISMIQNPGNITKENLSKINSYYRPAIRSSSIKWENERIQLYEPIANSTNMVRLTIVPLELRRHIFTAFHVNPLGGHFSTYYTLHRIRLRYHWPGMYSYIKALIDNCAACIMKNGGARASSELLYSFPLMAPMMLVHADAWIPGKTQSFDGYIGLMIVCCHMTGFAAVEPLRDMNSTSFSKAIYIIMLRYGLSQCIITDPDAKFKGQFKECCAILKIKHHLSARGHHDAILVERFNKFLNAGLRVFNNDRDTNRVFVEGAQTLTYAWNSCPVSGTDLSRSLLVVGREFQFPIDFESNKQITFSKTPNQIKLFADNLTDLLLKCREIYLILIAEHRTLHRELRNAQINKPREFEIGDVVFTNVQVQSKKGKGTVQKLAYVKRGPYQVIKDYKGGSYELKPLTGNSNITIKKHGSDLYLCPKSLVPFKSISSSDLSFGNLNKPSISNPFRLIGLEGYLPAKPWTASAAILQIHLADIKNIPPFPSVQELDDKFDGWPKSGNPFITIEHSPSDKTTTSPAIESKTFATNIRNRATIVADIVGSEDKLFFVSYRTSRNQTRREWKLVRVNFLKSIQQHPSCLQDGRFLVEFFIEHHRDKQLDITQRRYWLEYHRHDSHKSISVDYHIIQPSQYSESVATSKLLTPYQEWINIDDPEILLHGPFNFATLNNRKTRDRVTETDWNILAQSNAKYDNFAPTITQRVMHLDITQPIYERVQNDTEVSQQCTALMFHLEFNDQTLSNYGHDTNTKSK